ncbi:MAG: hypothetical protein ACI4VK_05840 [Candidatus Coproplasma sp.]
MTGENVVFTEGEKELFIEDLGSVCSEYFEGAEKFGVDVVTTENGLSVCIVFDAVRVRNFRKAR